MKRNSNSATIVIDVFRAFTTAAYILSRNPSLYILSTTSTIITELSELYSNSILVGKPEKGETLQYHIPNSPTRSQELTIQDKIILHRTEAGAKGILQALLSSSGIVLASCFANAKATIDYLKRKNITELNIMAMGHEATTPTLEDDLCAQYIMALWTNETFDIEAYKPEIKASSGQYFFQHDQLQYPRDDFNSCLNLNQFNFAIEAKLKNDYAILTSQHITHP
jgi:2-phosphosulfolactate phosphatase